MKLRVAAVRCVLGGTLFGLAAHVLADTAQGGAFFQRIATFPVFLNTDVELETVAEIVDVSENGNTLVYTDSEQELVGFVDINDPHNPSPDGTVAVGGEPTSVAVAGHYVLVAVNTSEDFVNTSGHLRVIDLQSREVITDIPLGGQPDSVAVSPDGRYAAVVIENERNEDLGDGRPPQDPPGFLVIVNLESRPKHWTTRKVELVGVPAKFPHDPEPEYVDINGFNVAVVTMQENNHIALVYLPNGEVVNHFSAGSVDLSQIDIEENDLIEFDEALLDVPREPDGVVWIHPYAFATADEGDLDGGSRGYTFLDVLGNVRYTSANSNDHLAGRLGHYPEDRSENKGNEPENVEFAAFGKDRFLFVGSERSSVVFVYRLSYTAPPQLQQILPAGRGPEGLKAIPGRELFVAASEVDDRDEKARSALTIYKLAATPTYPTLHSQDRPDGTPIPWGALSALAYHGAHDRVYSVYDSFYRKSRIFGIDTSVTPPTIDEEIVLRDSGGVLADASSVEFSEDGVVGKIALEDLVDDDNDGTVNLDPEGLTIAQDGGYWVASEGSGNLVDGVSDPDDRPFESPNLLLKVSIDGTITELVQLPEDLARNQLRFGFEGVASVPEGGVETLYVAFQREWTAAGDPEGLVRIGRYNTASGEWSFAYYQLGPATSPNGGWVGLSEIVSLGGQHFAVVERDNQAGSDARVKLIYRFSVADVDFVPNTELDGNNSAQIISADEKTLARDLIADGDLIRLNGQILEKVEGLAALPGGDALIVTDNDGVDDSRGETQLLELPGIF